MQRLKQVINIYLHKTGLSKGVAQNSAVLLWPEIVGKAVAENTQAVSAEHGVLTIKTSTPAWRQELQFQKKEIVLKINERIGNRAIMDIKFL